MFRMSDIDGAKAADARQLIPKLMIEAESRGDVMNWADFPDAVRVNGWPVEAHVSGDVVIRFPTVPDARGFHQVPFRMIVPQVVNLYVADRCASMTHEGQSSAGVSGPCYVMGQAAGTAAHLALTSGGSCAGVDVGALRTLLALDGVYFGTDTRHHSTAEAGRVRA